MGADATFRRRRGGRLPRIVEFQQVLRACVTGGGVGFGLGMGSIAAIVVAKSALRPGQGGFTHRWAARWRW